MTAQVERGYLAPHLANSAPQQGETWDVIMRDYHEHILPGITQWQHPMFFGYFPSNVTYEGILADMFAAMTTNPAFNWNASPAVTELEFIALNWIASMLGLSEAFHTRDEKSTSGGGVIQDSGAAMPFVARVPRRPLWTAW